MPKENLIRKKAIQILEERGWICWYPSKVRYQQTDVFGIIDILALRKREKKNIQLTTLPNVSAKRKKITDLKVLLLGVIEASKKLHIFMNVKETNLDKILTKLPALKRPTISKLAGDDSEGWYAINTIIEKDEFLNLIPLLRKYAQGLVVHEPRQILPLEQI